MTYTEIEKKFIGEEFKYNPKRCFYVGLGINLDDYPGFNTESFLQKYKINPDEKIILFLGRKENTKGVSQLISAMNS